ncbi:MAG TPA: dipeptide/oligopeptide/nickel ABC transporter permease/ATP-binding protein [Baekduia sp.]|uniref:dipeptide/oligopeptide/nickel ABC transporter permease/ATP-binding protein n=1 Tax=Baekduia sp. TaxID=2600305 RepID=UPI002D790B0F|nr:dipeptide/oligopeptide/nickel ABC transporter permease/ATP-binding protein [Baekduia sp.]HET6507607.1 dipeptide/oligopeptide/nickel ABC transporter permease/ATP-binding protein [Baekduia sp.]
MARPRPTARAVVVGVAVLVLLLAAVLGPTLLDDQAGKVDVLSARQGSSSAHWLGTDDLGRDIFARTVVATRLSLELSLAAALLAALVGFPLGALAGVLGPRARRAVGRVISVAVAFPAILVALFVCAIMGAGSKSAVIAMAIALTPIFARVAQTLAAAIATSDYMDNARVVGIGPRRLLWRYVLPNAAEPLISVTMVAAASALIVLSALSFLGLGVRPPQYDWGAMLSDGLERLYTTPVAALAPAVAIVFAGIVFTLVGEELARLANPMARRAAGPRRAARTTRDDAGAPAPRSAPAPAADDAAAAHADDAALVAAVADLEVTIGGGATRPVRGVSLAVAPGEVVGVVGESGSGKSMTALALSRLLPPSASVSASELRVAGVDLRRRPAAATRKHLATALGMVFQNPMSSLNPALRIGTQVTEASEVHLGLSRAEARQRAIARLTEVGIADAPERLRQHPHEWSGGMQQRAMIAAALMTDPRLIVADEPTTALDVTVQKQILELLKDTRERDGVAVLLISHDLGVVAEICDRVLVMYAGELVEEGLAADVLRAPLHPYTRALLASIPRLDTPRGEDLATIPGQPPAADADIVGCPFAPRCAHAREACGAQRPRLAEHRPAHRAACLRIGELESDPMNDGAVSIKAVGA